MAAHISNVRVVALPGIDHFAWFAGVDRISAEVEEFVTGVHDHRPSCLSNRLRLRRQRVRATVAWSGAGRRACRVDRERGGGKVFVQRGLDDDSQIGGHVVAFSVSCGIEWRSVRT